ncbi:MAG: ATPase domain-containing protein [Candidatus Nanohaloarchaea archaeon]
MAIDTGIEGLGDMVEIPDDYTLLLGGPPGTGKSAFALDYLFEGVQNGEKALFITLRDSKEEIMESVELRGYDSKSENFRIQEATGLMRGSSGQVFEPEKVIDGLRRNLNKFEPDRIVIDSITKFLMIFDAEPVQREEASRIVGRIKEKQASSLFIGEVPYSKNGQPSRYEIMEFVVDGIFKLEQSQDGIMFEILKMKGLGYDRKTKKVDISDNTVSLNSFNKSRSNNGEDSDYEEL